jgi:hypothetical protein
MTSQKRLLRGSVDVGGLGGDVGEGGLEPVERDDDYRGYGSSGSNGVVWATSSGGRWCCPSFLNSCAHLLS